MTENKKINGWSFERTVKTTENLCKLNRTCIREMF